MKILALEFSSSRRSVAAATDSGVAGFAEGGSHAESPSLALVGAALEAAHWERAEVEGIVVGLGPGSNAGIRGAISLAQGWQLARGVGLFGKASVVAIAEAARALGTRGKICVVIDAQRGECHAAGYEIDDRCCRPIEPLRILSRGSLQEWELGGYAIVGPEASGWSASGRDIFPSAASLWEAFASGERELVLGHELKPIHLREAQFVKSGQSKGGPRLPN